MLKKVAAIKIANSILHWIMYMNNLQMIFRTQGYKQLNFYTASWMLASHSKTWKRICKLYETFEWREQMLHQLLRRTHAVWSRINKTNPGFLSAESSKNKLFNEMKEINRSKGEWTSTSNILQNRKCKVRNHKSIHTIDIEKFSSNSDICTHAYCIGLTQA